MAAKTFDDILKFNPYHDSRGRFASANSATSFTYRTKDPSKQHMVDRAIAREKERQSAGGGDTDSGDESPRMKTVHSIEDKIRNQFYETAAVVDKDGNVLINKDGAQSQVGFTRMECFMMRDNTLTHNHPGSSMFSTEDAVCFVQNDLQEIRATTRQGVTFSLKRGQNYSKEEDGWRFIRDYEGERKAAHRIAQAELDSRGYRGMIMDGEITQEFANREFGKVVTREMVSFCDRKASSYNIDFTVEEREVSNKYNVQTYTSKSAGDDEIVMVLDQETNELDAVAFNEWLNGRSVAKTFDEILEIQKFNPYHDRLGRFTSAGSESSFTYAPGKSKAHDKAIERHKERMAASAPTEAQAKTLKGIESRTRNLKKEQFRVVDREGNVVMQKQGDKNSVSYSVGEARDNFPGNITIHNHPDGGTFSSADLSDIGYGATEIRAASPEGTYTLRNLNYRTKWTEDQKGWMDMRNDIEAASHDFKTHRQLKKELREPYEQQVKPISDKWAKMRSEGASQEELNKIAQEYTEKWDALKPQLEQATRKAYVDQYHHWYNANAGKYGFEYSFTPVQQKTRKSDTVKEFDEIEKSSGEIVLDKKMKEDVDEIVADILGEYPRDLMQVSTAKSMEDSTAVLFIGLKINGVDSLAIDGGEDTEDFHITLAYGHFDTNGHDEDDTSVRVQHAIDDIRDLIPDDIRFDALGRFEASESSDGKDVIYAQVAAGQLEKVHDGLLKALKDHGIKLEGTFPEYKPHMTLAYIDPDEEYELHEIDATGTATKVMIGHGWESTHENDYTIMKTDDDKRLVFGWASISITADGEQLEDHQQDLIDPEDLEEAVYEYVLNFRDTGEEHIKSLRKKGKLVESCVFTAEKQKAMGIPEGILPIGWWIGFKIEDDDAWEKVKNGTYKMFSIEGKANRVPVEKSAPTKVVSKSDPDRFIQIEEFP